MVCGRSVLGRAVIDDTKRFAWGDLPIAVGKDILIEEWVERLLEEKGG